jgi:ABC-type lipoprotein export system ATPase subunit
MSFLQASNLHKTYHFGQTNIVQALRGVSISIESGEMVAIMGSSGSGKSTLMHMLGLLQLPDQDSTPPPKIVIAGTEVTNLSDNQRTKLRAKSMGFIFQSFNLIPTLTAMENIALVAEYAGKSRKSSRIEACEALSWVNLSDRSNHRPKELSGGEQQRVAIARALVNRPTLILADEPTGNLDSTNTDDVLKVLKAFNSEHGQTVVIVTHDAEVSNNCGRILTMRDGAITENTE